MNNKSGNHPIKKTILGLPVIGSVLRTLNYTVRAPKYQDQIIHEFEVLHKEQKDFETTISESVGLFAENHLLDVFYKGFEDRFRGSEEDVTSKLRVYLELFTKSKIDFNKYPVLDIGCGRGEFLKLMKASNINAQGVDINTDMVKHARQQGLKVDEHDVLSYMAELGPASLGAVTGFHIVEHIPFQLLLKLFFSIHNSLVDGGLLLFETPNPENFVVGSSSFYNDPSHIKPIPPQLLAYIFEMSGFKDIKIRRLNPEKTKNTLGLPDDLFTKVYGSLDYSVTGIKY